MDVQSSSERRGTAQGRAKQSHVTAVDTLCLSLLSNSMAGLVFKLSLSVLAAAWSFFLLQSCHAGMTLTKKGNENSIPVIYILCDVRGLRLSLFNPLLLNLICRLNCSHGYRENICTNVTQGCAGVKAHARPLNVS